MAGEHTSGSGETNLPAAAIELGHQLDLDVLEEIGRGAKATVYRVARGDREYALKIMTSATSEDLDEVSFRREAVLLAAVDHPGLYQIHAVGRVQNRPYLIMDLIAGRTLPRRLADGALTPATVIQFGIDLASLLAAADLRGLVHRDVKPTNIIISADDHASLVDFGLVTRSRRASDEAPTEVAGTLLYASPEQAGMLHRPVDGRSDMYSLGVVLFECLAGEPPFASTDVGELLRMHAIQPPPDLRQLRPDAPEALVAVVERLLAKDPDDRYPEARALMTELLALVPNSAAEASASIRPASRDASGVRPSARDASGVRPSARDASGVRPSARDASGGPASQRPTLGSPTPDLGGLAAGGPGVGNSAMVGRERELAQLSQRWTRACAGAGGVAIISGGRGTGRSRMEREFAASVRRSGAPVLEGGCVEADPVPLAALRSAMDGYLDRVEALPPNEREQALDRLRSSAAPTGGLVRALSPRLARHLPPEPAGASTDEERQDEFAVATALFLAALAREHDGLLLCLDDAQWLDDASSRVLAQLSTELARTPLLVAAVLSETADGPDSTLPPWTDALPHTPVDVHIALGPLTDGDVEALLAGLLPGIGIPRELTAGMVRLCQGNPLAVTEYVRAVVDAALLHPSWGVWRFDADGLDRLELPADAAQLPLARLVEFDEAGRALFTAAAVMGNAFSTPVLAAATGLTDDVVIGHLTRATELGLLERFSDGRYEFVHRHLRTSLLAAADPGQLRGFNHAAALHLAGHGPDGDERAHTYALAQHFMNGDPDQDREAAFDACWAAGRLALTEHAPAEALTFLRHAAAVPEAAASAAFLRTYGTALQRDGQFDEAVDALGQALELETVPLQRAHLWSLLAQVHRSLWQTRASVDAVRHGLAELGHPMPRGIRALLTTIVMVIAAGIVELTGWGRGTLTGEKRERYLLRANLHETGGYAAALNLQPLTMAALDFSSLYLVSRVGPSPEYGKTYGGVGFLLRVSYIDGLAQRAFNRATRIARSVGDLRLVAQVAWHDAIAMYLRGADDGESLEEVTRSQGRWLDVGSFCDGIGCVAMEALLRGHTTDAAAWLDLGHERVRSQALADRTALAQLEIAVPAALGHVAQAGTRLHRAEQTMADETTDIPLRITLLVAACEALAAQSDLDARFEAVVGRFAGLKVLAPLLMRFHLPIFAVQAEVRLTQYRLAPPEQLRERRRAARSAIRALRLSSRSGLLRALRRVASAELRRIDADPAEALAMLDRVRTTRRDAPAVAYQVAVVRARAHRDLGHEETAQRYAHMALAEAHTRGWPHRRRQVMTEFSLDAGIPVSSTRSRQFTGSESSAGRSASYAGNAAQRLAALEQVGQAATRTFDPDALARIALDETIRILAADRAFLFLAEDPDGELVAHLGRDSSGHEITELTAYSASLIERVRESGEPLVVTGTDEGEALGSRSAVIHGLRSILAAPLQLEDRVLGVVYLDSRVAKGIFTPDDVGILTAISNYVAASLETARAAQLDAAVKIAKRERDIAETLRTALSQMSSTLSPAEVIDHLLRSATALLPGHARMIREDGSSFDVTRGGRSSETAMSGPSDALAEWLQRHPIEPTSYPGDEARELASALGPAAFWLVVPVGVRCERIGTVVLSREDASYDTTQIELAATLAAQAMVAYDNARLFTKVERMATVDALTGVSNRRAFFDQAPHALDTHRIAGRKVAALMIDIDHFKLINDTYGHQSGDEVLQQVAQRLAEGIRAGDLLARYGGEEFVVLLLCPDGEPDFPRVEQLRAAIGSAPVDTRHGGLVTVTVSVGMAYLNADDDLDQLLVRADAALYQAKRSGRDKLVLG